MVLKNPVFRQKSQDFSISNGNWELLWRQIYYNNWFSDGKFYIIIPDADIESPQSLHTLFDKYLDHMLMKFERNPKVWTIQNFELFDKKWLTIFDNVLMPFWKTFLWLKQLFNAKLLI